MNYSLRNTLSTDNYQEKQNLEQNFPRKMLLLVLLFIFIAKESVVALRMQAGESRGFGKTKIYIPHQQLELTRPGEHREVTGRFSKFLAKRCENFERLKNKSGFPVACDLYARLSGTSTFWFCGKLIHDTGIKFEEAFSIEYPVICEYSKALRPKELAKINHELQIWFAPGNSEMDVAQNKISLKYFAPLAVDVYSHILTSSDIEDFVGFEPEVYQGGEQGFRCQRSDQGEPLKPAFEVKFEDKPPI